MLNDIADLRPSIYAVVVRKQDLPSGWNVGGRDLYRKTADVLVRDVMKDTDGTITVIFDEHTALHGGFIDRVVRDAAATDRREIRGVTQARSIDERALRAHDFVTGSSRDRHSFRKKKPYDEIEDLTKTREIKK